MDRIPRLPALVQSFFGIFFCVLCCCFRGYNKISMAFDFFLVFRFSWGCSCSFKMKYDSRSFACCFYFLPRVLARKRQTERSKGICCTRLTVEKEVCRSFGCRKHVARLCNYRLVWSLRSRYRPKRKTAYRRKITAMFWFYRLRQSRYRQKTKNRLPPKYYRHILFLSPPPKSLPPKNEKPPTAEKLLPYGITARLCPPKKALPTITLFISHSAHKKGTVCLKKNMNASRPCVTR